MGDLQQIANIENLENVEEALFQRNNRFEMIDPFEVLSEHHFTQYFRLSKELCRYLVNIIVNIVEPFMRRQRRTTDLSVEMRVLPLENNMKNPLDFGGWNGVLNTGMVIVTALYTAVGFFGYLKYGERAVLGSITLLIPPDELLAQSVRLMMASAIFLSYSIQFYVPFNIMWPSIRNHFETEKSKDLAEYITRAFLVFFTFIIAIAIPNLGAVISLVGAFSSSALALIFPPFVEIITFWPDCLGRNKWILWKDISIILFGCIGFVIGSYTSLLNILE